MWPSSPGWRWRTELGKWCVISCPLCWRGCRTSWPPCTGRPFCGDRGVWWTVRRRSWRRSSSPGLWPRWWRRWSRRCWRCCWPFWTESRILSSEMKEGSKVKSCQERSTRLNNTSIWTHKEEIEATPRDTTHTRTKQKPNQIFNPGHVSLKRFLKRKVEKKKSLPIILKLPNLTYSIHQWLAGSYFWDILTLSVLSIPICIIQIWNAEKEKKKTKNGHDKKIHDEKDRECRNWDNYILQSVQNQAGLASDTANSSSSSTEQD